jgi:hypothetical protein
VVPCPGIEQTTGTTMISRLAMTNDATEECALGFAPVFAALGSVRRQPNAVNRFAYSKREVLFAM